jgi:hypothetical protein
MTTFGLDLKPESARFPPGTRISLYKTAHRTFVNPLKFAFVNEFA